MIKILFLYWIITRYAPSQSVSWTVGTSVPRYNEDLKLVCTVPTGCCSSSARIWADGAGNHILSNGNSASPNKYEEDWDGGSTGFSLIIKNLQLSDVGVVYDCQYSIGSDKHNLTQDATWEYQPSLQEKGLVEFSEPGLKGTLQIARSAPSPTVFASYGGKNVTSDLTLKGPTNFETWFYTSTVSIDIESCIKNARLNLSVITGTSTTVISNEIIECLLCHKCGLRCLGWGCCGFVLAVLVFAGLCCQYLDIELRIAVLIAAVSSSTCFHLNYCIALPVGFHLCICYDTAFAHDPFFILVVVLILCGFIIVHMCRNLTCTGHGIKEYMLRTYLYYLTLGLLYVYDCYNGDKATVGSTVVLKCPYKVADKTKKIAWYKIIDGKEIIYSEAEGINPKLSQELISRLKVTGGHKDGEGEYHLSISNVHENDKGTYQCSLLGRAGAVYRLKLTVKGGKSQSVESGSSCWPICRVGQDPNTSSSNPEKVRRSPEKERADKKKERKPTEVVRPQPSRPLPSRAQHLKTDNSGREEYSAENELFKPRPLPSISGHSDSQRPLPKRTPDDQLEKGGIQLEPLVDSTSEKKKKKKRKKKETK